MHDYIIVGAGSAGCALAGRLTETQDNDVLLIEAGGADGAPELATPAQWGGLAGSEWDWNFISEPEPGLGGRPMSMPRGRVLGGSSSTNGMIYIRGNRLDYEEWTAVGDESWGYETALAYFKRSEDNQRGASEFHGVGGPLTVSDASYHNPLTEAFVEAAVISGIPSNDDFNGAVQEGVGIYQLTIRGGRRCSAATAFLRPAIGRPNLTLTLNARVTRIVFDGDRATGVELVEGSQTRIEIATKEVILSAGAFATPQLLMLSGIGPSGELKRLGIHVVDDLADVGANLRDHVSTFVSWTTPHPVGEMADMGPDAVAEFQSSGTGPLSSNLLLPGGFVKSDPSSPAPDIQFHVGAFALVPLDANGRRTTAPGFGITIIPYLCKPASSGRLTLGSADPFARPRILNGYYTSPGDIQTGLAAVRLAMQIAKARPFHRFQLEPCHLPSRLDDATASAYLRETAGTVFHPVGTCAMGSVVDSELRVLGVQGVRVVDASIMPTIPRGNTNAPTIMVAEKAADLIRHGPTVRTKADIRAAI
jgi:choline dehydrogenase